LVRNDLVFAKNEMLCLMSWMGPGKNKIVLLRNALVCAANESVFSGDRIGFGKCKHGFAESR